MKPVIAAKYCAAIVCLGVVCLLVASPLLSAESDEIKAMKKLYEWPLEIPYPEDNPFSVAKEDLGKKLFFDPRLSESGLLSCATCHNPSLHWEDGLPKAIGRHDKKLKRSTPTILNMAWDDLFFLDGRAESLEAQSLMPIETENEMNMDMGKLIEFLQSTQEYVHSFQEAFPEDGEEISKENMSKAIATFERGIISSKAPFDNWIEGKEGAISEAAKRGFVLFNGKANCAACHSDWRFSDGSFHDIGLDDADIGRGEFLPHIPFMQHAFKTVGLRNIEGRAPYMHNGSMNTLEEVIDHYNDGFVERESLSDEIKPLGLTPEEKSDLVEFLKSLTSEDPLVTMPVLPQ